MRRVDLIKMLAEFVGPTGPLGSLADKFHVRDEQIANTEFDDVDELLDVFVNPPELAPIYTEDGRWESALIDSLIVWGRRNPARMLQKIAPLMGPQRVLAAIFKIIGGLRHPDGLRALAPFVDRAADLHDDERIALAGALGEIGGNDAREMLGRLSGAPNTTDAVAKEIALAQTAASAPPERRPWYYGTLRETFDQLKMGSR